MYNLEEFLDCGFDICTLSKSDAREFNEWCVENNMKWCTGNNIIENDREIVARRIYQYNNGLTYAMSDNVRYHLANVVPQSLIAWKDFKCNLFLK